MNEKRKNDLQLSLTLSVVAVKESDGDIFMGVFEDGTPFLTERGLAVFAGISNSTLNELSKAYMSADGGVRPREAKIAQMLAEQGFKGVRLYEKTMVNGTEVNAYPGVVCMVILEYYAFEAEERYRKEEAKRNYRLMGRKSFKDFVYQMTGYQPVLPNEAEAISWKNYQERLILNPVPEGYFSVLEESYPLEMKIIRSGLQLDQHTIPDISIGGTWGRYWSSKKLDRKFQSQRIKYPHVYPGSYAQSKANGRIEQWIYPMSAISEFKTWLQTDYVMKKMPKYLKDKVDQRKLSPSQAKALLDAVTPKQLPKAS